MRYSGAFFEQDEITKFTKVELQECENNLKAYRDWYSVTKTDFGKGKAKGKEEGRAECETNKAR